jgi:hypothetical protein
MLSGRVDTLFALPTNIVQQCQKSMLASCAGPRRTILGLLRIVLYHLRRRLSRTHLAREVDDIQRPHHSFEVSDDAL